MSKERPPIGPSGHVGTGASNDVGPDATRESIDAEKEFEFSRLVIGEQVPFAVPEQRIERTWARLAKAAAPAGSSSGRASKRLTGPLMAIAACAATFAAGVWVGEGNGGLRSAGGGSPRVMSAEPIGLTLPASGAAALPAEEPMKAAGQGLALAPSAAFNVPSTNLDVGASQVTGATRLTHGVRSPVSLSPGASALSAVLPAPMHTTEVAAIATAVSVPAWQLLASKGDDEGALVAIAAAGGFEQILLSASAEQLIVLSDVARGTGQQQRALAALRRIVSEHSTDQVAPMAAWNMGNLLDKLGDGAGAMQAFGLYRELSPNGDFAEDALVRQIRSAVRAGQQGLARGFVRQYEVDFPEGRRADEVARWAEQIPTQSESADAGTAFGTPEE